MKDIPKLPVIKAQYKAICDILKDCHTVEDARRLEKKLDLTIEIGNFNDFDADSCQKEFFDNIKPEQIDWFRVEAWDNLGYVYYYTNGSFPYFDIYADNEADAFLEDVTINTLDKKYEDFLDNDWLDYCKGL